ncbi:MAG: hypothetical protein AVDCRST_MAG85-1927, partial [uncultured Solirubrobacteraceae bacterium]
AAFDRNLDDRCRSAPRRLRRRRGDAHRRGDRHDDRRRPAHHSTGRHRDPDGDRGHAASERCRHRRGHVHDEAQGVRLRGREHHRRRRVPARVAVDVHDPVHGERLHRPDAPRARLRRLQDADARAERPAERARGDVDREDRLRQQGGAGGHAPALLGQAQQPRGRGRPADRAQARRLLHRDDERVHRQTGARHRLLARDAGAL